MKTAIALWCIVAVGCKQNPVIQQSSGYATMTVSTSEKTLSNNYSASIRGKQDIDIYPQVSGFITKLCVAEGESVKKGQVLFIIDQVPYQAALNTAIANVEAAKASVATAQLTYESKQELYKNKVVSEFDLKTAYNTLLSAKAQLAQAKAQEVNARNNLSYTEVKSPMIPATIIVMEITAESTGRSINVLTFIVLNFVLLQSVFLHAISLRLRLRSRRRYSIRRLRYTLVLRSHGSLLRGRIASCRLLP